MRIVSDISYSPQEKKWGNPILFIDHTRGLDLLWGSILSEIFNNTPISPILSQTLLPQ